MNLFETFKILESKYFSEFVQRVKPFLRPAYANQNKWNLSREHK